MTSQVSSEPDSARRLPIDRPIVDGAGDRLGRREHAVAFAHYLRELDSSTGIVVGVLGPWGSGKTSYVNMVREALVAEKIPVLEFNPWLFSGTEQLVNVFFAETASELKLRTELADIGKTLGEYGETLSTIAWLPVVGTWIEGSGMLAKFFGGLLAKSKTGSAAKRARLEKALSELKRPLVVVVDDVDRLSTPEIRDIFRLVRLTASFPKIIYIVAFDRARVEQALSEDKLPGRDYLEKILQFSVDLPVAPQAVLDRQVFAVLDSAISAGGAESRFDADAWPDVYAEVIRPLLRNMRDVRRLGLAATHALRSLGAEVAAADVIALEAIRVFLPDVHGLLAVSVKGLTTASAGWSSRDESPHLKNQVENLVRAGGQQDAVVRAMVTRLFPAAARHVGGSIFGTDWTNDWQRKRRVASEDVLRFYLERTANAGLLALGSAERAFSLLSDEEKLDAFLRALPPDQLEDAISGLEAYESDFRPEHVVPGTAVLLNILPAVPERARDFFSFGPRLSIARVTLRLVRSLKEPETILSAVRSIIPRLMTLSAKAELVSDVGHEENEGHKLVDEADGQLLARELRDEIRRTSPDVLAEEPQVMWLLLSVKRRSRDDEPAFVLPDSGVLTAALIRAARSETVSASLGSRNVRRSFRLQWGALVELFGSEETLKDRISAVPTDIRERFTEYFALADRYVTGWRPSRDTDD